MNADAVANDATEHDAVADNSDMYKYCCSLLSLSCLTSLTSLLFFAIIYACFTTFFYAYILYTLVHLSSLCPSISVALTISFILLIAIYISSILALRYRYHAKHKRSAVTLQRDAINHDETRPIVNGMDTESYSSMTDTSVTTVLSSPLLSRSQSGSAMIVHRRKTARICTCSLSCILTTIYAVVAVVMFIFLLLVFATVIYFQINSTPHYTGTMYVKGLTGTVTITRDSSAIIHINARTHGDLHFGQGVAMAQSRMWQMEFQRRVGSGRLSEIIGANPDVIAIDRLSRTFGFYRAAEASIAFLPDHVISNITAFIGGVNTYLASSPPLALELLVLGTGTPEPWTIADVLVWSKMMSFTLSGNYDREILRWDLLTNRHLSPERIEEMIPPFDVSRFPTVIPTEPNATKTGEQTQSKRVEWTEPIIDWLKTHWQQDPTQSHTLPRPVHSTMALYQKIYRRMFGSTQASNNWVVSGAMTTTKRPLLCNDPHLQLMAPSIWLLMHLQISESATVQPPNFFTLDVIGACLPGIPGIVIGRNQFIAWGVTNTGADVQDVYVHSGNATHYDYNNESVPYMTRQETINIDGADPVTFTVRSSIYGPIISDLPTLPDTQIPSTLVTNNSNHTMALQWTSLFPNDTTILAFLQVNYARDWREFVHALESYVAPSQNFVYADRQGHIGYVMSGKIPLRVADHSGLYPVPGNGSYDWQGFVPFTSMPIIEATTQGYIISANNRVTNTSFPLPISYDWDGLEGYRAKRIDQMIRNSLNHSASSMKSIQNDQTSLLFQDLKWTLNHIHPQTSSGRLHQTLLKEWNGILNIGSTQATLFEAWYMELTRITMNETGHSSWNVPQYITQIFNYQIRNNTRKNNNNNNNNNNINYTILFNDNNTTNNNNTSNIDNNDDIACRYYHSIYHSNSTQSGCLQYASDMFDRISSMDNLKSDADVPIPTWGSTVHQAIFQNQLLGSTMLSCLANRMVNHGGDWFTVNVGDYYIPDTSWLPLYNHYTTNNDDNNNDAADDSDNLLSAVAGPSYRQIIDLSFAADGINDDSFYINSLGQSGNEMDDGVNAYDNMLTQWANGDYINIKAVISQADKAFQITLQTS